MARKVKSNLRSRRPGRVPRGCEKSRIGAITRNLLKTRILSYETDRCCITNEAREVKPLSAADATRSRLPSKISCYSTYSNAYIYLSTSSNVSQCPDASSEIELKSNALQAQEQALMSQSKEDVKEHGISAITKDLQLAIGNMKMGAFSSFWPAKMDDETELITSILMSFMQGKEHDLDEPRLRQSSGEIELASDHDHLVHMHEICEQIHLLIGVEPILERRNKGFSIICPSIYQDST